MLRYAQLLDAHPSPLLLSTLFRAHRVSVRVYAADAARVKVIRALP